MEDRKEESYISLFKDLKSLLNSKGKVFSPISANLDFEQASYSALNKILGPNSKTEVSKF